MFWAGSMDGVICRGCGEGLVATSSSHSEWGVGVL